MKYVAWIAALLLTAGTLIAATSSQPLPEKPETVAQKPAPGVEAAQAVSTLTGVAISPLLGAGAVGAWKYARTPAERRARLPWYAQPWFWLPALLLVLLVFLKDALGPVMPTALKKPFDILELFENKVSAVVLTGAFVPLVASIFHAVDETSHLSGFGLAMINLVPLFNLVTIPLAMAVFVVVFLASHAINVLILLSPFATLDAGLKSLRFLLVSSVAGTSMANPYLGAAWALTIIVVSYFIAGWSLRMSVFGSVFAWDLLTFHHRRFTPDTSENWAFTAGKIGNTPTRTWGRLARDSQGRLELRYRPWLVLPTRTVTLPPGGYFVGRGMLYSEVRRTEATDSSAQLALPPRYRDHEADFARLYQLGPVQDIGLKKGLKGLWAWLKDLFRGGEPAAKLA